MQGLVVTKKIDMNKFPIFRLVKIFYLITSMASMSKNAKKKIMDMKLGHGN